MNMFRFDDAIEPSFHIAGLPFHGGKRQTRNVGSKESEHIYDNSYKRGLSANAPSFRNTGLHKRLDTDGRNRTPWWSPLAQEGPAGVCIHLS